MLKLPFNKKNTGSAITKAKNSNAKSSAMRTPRIFGQLPGTGEAVISVIAATW
jgi:hypothetical protein